MLKKIIFSIAIATSICAQSFSQDKLTLENAIAIGLKNNFDIKISLLKSDVADLNNKWGMVGAYPTITGTAQYNFSKELVDDPKTMSNTAGASIDASLTLFNGFKIQTSKRINEMKYVLAKDSEVIQIENAVSDIVLSYYSYVLECRLLEFNRTSYVLSKDRYEREKIAVEIGGKGNYELIQAESAYLSDYQTFLNQEKRVTSSLITLNEAMGVEHRTKWDINRDIAVPNKDYAVGMLIDKMVSNNSTLKYQYINQKVTEENIELAKGDMMPKLDLKAGGRYNFASTDRGDGSTNNNTFQPYGGLTLSATIFAGEVKQRNLSIAKVQAKIGSVTIEQMKQEMTATLLNTYDSYDYNRRLLALATREMEVADINLKLSLERLSNGAISSFDYRSVQLSFIRAANNVVQLTYSLLKSNVELTRLTGEIIQEYK